MGVRGEVEQLVDSMIPASSITIQERRSAEGLDGHIPMILRDGMLYDPDLDRFFRDLPLTGVRSRHSLRAYGYDVLVWVRFLSEAAPKQCGRLIDRTSFPTTGFGDAPNPVNASLLLPGIVPSLVSIAYIDGASRKGCSLKHRSRIDPSGGRDMPAGGHRSPRVTMPMKRPRAELTSVSSRSTTTGGFEMSVSERCYPMAECAPAPEIATGFAMRCFPISW